MNLCDEALILRRQLNRANHKLTVATAALTRIVHVISKQKEDDAGEVYDIARNALLVLQKGTCQLNRS